MLILVFHILLINTSFFYLLCREAGSVRTFDDVINIDARRKPRSEELEKVYGEMTLQDHNLGDSVADQNDGNDLLELLDSLNS